MRAIALMVLAACAHPHLAPPSNCAVAPPACRALGRRPEVGWYRRTPDVGVMFWLAIAEHDRDVMRLEDWANRAERCIEEGR